AKWRQQDRGGPSMSQERIATDFSAWAGGRDNAEALGAGLHRGTPITLATHGRDNPPEKPGLQAPPRISYHAAGPAPAPPRPRSDLARLGVRRPSAVQIRAALIGGDVRLSDGRTRALRGSVAMIRMERGLHGGMGRPVTLLRAVP